jgi:hypothetical protein
MSLYWYAYCPAHKVRCEAGDSHGEKPIEFVEEFGLFAREHAGCRIQLCCDPDHESDPEFYECEEFKP